MKVNKNEFLDRVNEVASDFLFRFGVRGWNMDMVADKVGISKKTLYKMINSKEELIFSIIYHLSKRNIEEVNSILTKEREYADLFDEIMEVLVSNIGELNSWVLSQVYIEYPQIESKMDNLIKKMGQNVINFLKRGMDEGYLRDEIDPYLVFQSFNALVLHFIKIEKSEYDYKRKVRAGFQLLIHGLKKGV